MKSKTLNNVEATPSHVLLSPVDNNKVLDFINFNAIGSNLITGSNAFKKIQSASKSTSADLYNSTSDYTLKYNKINNLYLNDLNTQDSLFYGMKRQHEYASTSAVFNNSNSYLDNKSVSKVLDYNYDNNSSFMSTGAVKEFNTKVGTFDADSTPVSVSSNTGKNYTNLNNNLTNINTPVNMLDDNVQYRTLEVKSPNQQVLSSDRNVRNIENLNPLNKNYNFITNSSLIESASSTFPTTHIPTGFHNSGMPSVSYDKFTPSGMNSPIMSAKEELAPNFVFTPFWSTLWANSDINLRLNNSFNFNTLNSIISVPTITEYTEYDFRN
jgi:hypothetical protein